MASQFIYHMQNLNKLYTGGKKVLDNMQLSFYSNAKIGVLGPNGSGKSTLLKIMAGIDRDFSGEAWSSEGTKIGYLAQEPELDSRKTLRENVMDGIADKTALLERYNESMMNYSDEVASLQDQIDSEGLWDLDIKVDAAMSALQCPDTDMPVQLLSGGERRRVALCRLLLSEPDLLLLDEPTNHLDAETISWLEQHLREFKGAVVMVTHDRYFLDNVTNWILELDRGHGIPYEGNYSAYLEKKKKRMIQEGREQDARMRQLDREREWIGQSPKARQVKSKARINKYHELVEAANERKPTDNQIFIPVAERLGQIVIEANCLSKGFDKRPLIENLNFKLPAGGIVGIIGPNGAGKSTLFKMITGEETPDSGTIRIGETVKLGYVDQNRDSLDACKTVWEEISGGAELIKLGRHTINSRAYVSSFNFKKGDQQKKIGMLSGGQRNRIHLAKMLKSGANVLLLDEPTNDLDTETLSSLETSLEEFGGCAVIISHDRMFLDRLTTHILAFEGHSHVEWFQGNFEDYEKSKIARFSKKAKSSTPKRIHFKSLNR
ncbi:energy-dependent translational throttle protein EttA [Candidatus Endowatersipora endosymbiont of Watersipora subatra]|uniref:energy-dependent translational throttle protein EttA n=1 Tax=Candidatus Endowatersipora endosymbiont of Watersipora subatra TaxID=3077946 RepID=UPI00312C76AE